MYYKILILFFNDLDIILNNLMDFIIVIIGGMVGVCVVLMIVVVFVIFVYWYV